MSKKQDKETPTKVIETTAPVEVLDSDVEDLDFANETLKVEVQKAKPRSIIEPIEAYGPPLSNAQKAAIREYHISSFPPLFAIKGYKTDVSSKHPALEMSDPVKLYTALREENIKMLLKRESEKKTH